MELRVDDDNDDDDDDDNIGIDDSVIGGNPETEGIFETQLAHSSSLRQGGTSLRNFRTIRYAPCSLGRAPINFQSTRDKMRLFFPCVHKPCERAPHQTKSTQSMYTCDKSCLSQDRVREKIEGYLRLIWWSSAWSRTWLWGKETFMWRKICGCTIILWQWYLKILWFGRCIYRG